MFERDKPHDCDKHESVFFCQKNRNKWYLTSGKKELKAYLPIAVYITWDQKLSITIVFIGGWAVLDLLC